MAAPGLTRCVCVLPDQAKKTSQVPGRRGHADAQQPSRTLFEFEKYIPLVRIQVAENLAGVVIFPASHAGGYITEQTLRVNSGLLMAD